MNLNTEVEVVRHVISRLISCPYNFKNYTIVREGSFPQLNGPIGFIKEDNTGVYAVIPWDVNGRYKMDLAEVEIKLQLDDEGGARAIISFIDRNLISKVDTFYVESDKHIDTHYDALTDFAYTIVGSINRNIGQRYDLHRIDDPLNQSE